MTGGTFGARWGPGIFCTALFCVLAFFAVVLVGNAVALHERGVETTAEVTDERARGGGRRSSPKAAVTFTTASGHREKARIPLKDFPSPPRVGDTVQVRYVPDHPDVVVLVSAGFDPTPVIVSFFTLLIGAAAVLTLAGRFRWQRVR